MIFLAGVFFGAIFGYISCSIMTEQEYYDNNNDNYYYDYNDYNE